MGDKERKYTGRDKSCDRVEYILNTVKGRRVLHLGCADWPFTKSRLEDGSLLHGKVEQVAAAQYGVDMEPQGIDMLRAAGYTDIAVATAEETARRNPFGNAEFDVVLAGEIIEHVSNPGLFLDSLKPLLAAPHARLVLTTVNAYSIFRILYLLLRRIEHVHSDHVAYYSKSTLIKLVEDRGYIVDDFAFFPIGLEHKQAVMKGPRRVLWWMDRLASRYFPAFGNGVMLCCRLERPHPDGRSHTT